MLNLIMFIVVVKVSMIIIKNAPDEFIEWFRIIDDDDDDEDWR